MKLNLDLSLPKAPPRVSRGVAALLIIILVTSMFTIWADYPWNGNPFTWLTAKEAFMDGIRARERFAMHDAIADLQKAIKIYPRDAHFQFALGEALLREGRFADAEPCFVEATKLQPDMVSSWLYLSTIQHMQGHVEAAQESCRKAIKLDPKNAEAQCQLALLLANSGKADEAAKLFDATRNMDRDTARYWFLAGQYYEKGGKWQEAETAYRQAVNMDRGEPNYSEWLGMLLCANGRVSEAIEWLRPPTRVYPRCAQYWENLGIAFSGVKEYEQAALAFSRAVQIEPANDLFMKRLGISLHEAKRYKLAEEPLQKLVAKGSDDLDVWNFYIDCLVRTKTYGQAESNLAELVNKEQGPTKARTLTYLADLYSLQGKLLEANQSYQEALSLNPEGRLKSYLEAKVAQQKFHK